MVSAKFYVFCSATAILHAGKQPITFLIPISFDFFTIIIFAV